MANQTVTETEYIRDTNPQDLVEKIVQSRILNCTFWKEECFGLTAALLVDKAIKLRFIGGVFGCNAQPTPFICLVLKMLQLQPEKDIIVEFIKNEDYKYVRALGAFYMRLTRTAFDCYRYLEPLQADYRNVCERNGEGEFKIITMDEFIDNLFKEERSCSVLLPRLQLRHDLEENNKIEPKVFVIDVDMHENINSSEDDYIPSVMINKKRRI
ncbi:pre-mRNA-splicing factor 38A-like [Trichogramma pretiosum]|uniref:pre-mRNA-splicing factor 38A-like n=1 Tax=Trichogramma pretiosum TaxID=7493 RepID=UPI0006C9709B|nr:pre-mRNA-splicing factor 38A-like [Trichogramma pretiosum]